MTEIFVGTEGDFDRDARRFIEVDGREIGVLRHDGDYFAFENRCFHQGGPVCEGMVIGRVQTLLSPEGEQIGQQFSDVDIHLVCPWHGWEYNLRTGVCAADPRFRLKRFEVACRDGEVYVSVGNEPIRGADRSVAQTGQSS